MDQPDLTPINPEEQTDSLALESFHGGRLLTKEEFKRLGDVPPEVEWFANLDSTQTRRGYKTDLNDYSNVKRWFEVIASRPAVVKGMAVPFLN